MSGNSCNGNYARGTQSKGHSMKAKDELARLKRDLATLYKATSKEKAVNTGRPKKQPSMTAQCLPLHGLLKNIKLR